MILDSSALVAVLADEPDSERYIQATSRSPVCRISAGNLLELSIVIQSQFGAEVVQQSEALFRRVWHCYRTRDGRTGVPRTPSLPRLRQGSPRSRAEFRRLLRLCACRDRRRAPSLQN